MKLRLPNSYYNLTSYLGTALAAIALFMFVFLYVLSSVSSIDRAYVGIVIFLVIPAFIILGLLLIPYGMWRTVRKQKKEGKSGRPDFPILDLNQPQQRNATVIFALGTLVFLFLSALGSYEAYHYTESVEFCGRLCHHLMIPEYTAYHTSPHARVTCAECHVGTGANWYVKSKMSGLYQVYSTIFNKYSRPIETPVKNLRPARETCEECHWPQKVYGKQQRHEIYYLADEANTKWQIDILMNTGGGNPALGQSSGIHWHINPDIEVDYITTDHKRSIIPRVILKNKATGETIVYDNIEAPLDESAEFQEQRSMDCIDCHNRPSHIYRDPSKFINIAIAAGEIDASLPMIKTAAVQACLEEYESTEQALAGIAEKIKTYYQENYPEILESKSEAITKSIAGAQKAFGNNMFPEMKVRWEAYPDHIGHFNSEGCYRCHNGKHASADGQVISHDCEACHLITSQGADGTIEYASSQKSLEFKHPVDIGEAWREAGCYECHASPPL